MQYLVGMQIQENIPLAPFTTFRIGGSARWYCAPKTPDALAEALAWARERALPYFVLGRGSNVLVADAGYSGLVIHTLDMNEIEWGSVPRPERYGDAAKQETRREVRKEARNEAGRSIRCGAGCSTAALASEAAERGLSGLEFAGGLPGSIGGAAVMNARAYGGELADVFAEAELIAPNGEIARRGLDEMHYAYKYSALLESGEIASAITLALTPARDADERAAIRRRTEENRAKRTAMGQFRWPNAGCVFKNDYNIGIPSGRLIDEAGLKGIRAGGAAVLEEHANFIVNRDNARASDVRELIERIKKIIFEKHGIMLEEEIRYLGFCYEI